MSAVKRSFGGITVEIAHSEGCGNVWCVMLREGYWSKREYYRLLELPAFKLSMRFMGTNFHRPLIHR
jgi:hypothetical protein